MNYLAASFAVSTNVYAVFPKNVTPKVFIGVQSEFAWIPAKSMRE